MPAASPDVLRAWFDDYLDAWNRHDLAALGALIAPDVRRAHLPRGTDAWLANAAELLVGFPDLQWRRIVVVVEGDRLAAHLRARGTHRGAFRSVPATGRHVNVAAFAIHRVAAGRLVESAGTDDGAALLAQLAD